MCEVHDIISRISLEFFNFERDVNFTLGPNTTAENEIVVRENGWTLFSFNFKNGTAVFLYIGAEHDLSVAPFAYAAQYEKASRVAAMPFQAFLQLAKDINAHPDLVHLFNIGHCGSTLLHHVFNASGEAWCISEPLFTFDLAMNRHDVSPKLLQDLAEAALHFLALFPGASRSNTIVLKHFSQATTLFDVWHNAAPHARCLYLYRDALGWCNSLFGFVQRIGHAAVKDMGFMWYMVSANRPVSQLSGLIDLENTHLAFEDLAAVAWGFFCQDYHTAIGNGVPLLPFRYNELNYEKEKTVTEIFQQCGLSPTHIAEGLRAFDRDSHEGSVTAHDKPVLKLSASSLERVTRVLSHPRLAVSADVILTL